jgi:predicted nucleic acid-binding Zn ribbon protein
MKNKHCEWCDHSFIPNVAYQIYCSAECREDATKEKIRARYVLQRIKKRAASPRKCRSCGIPLSVYNDSAICSACEIDPKDVSKALKEIKDMMKDET